MDGNTLSSTGVWLENFRMSKVTFLHVCMRAIQKLFPHLHIQYVTDCIHLYIAFSIQLIL